MSTLMFRLPHDTSKGDPRDAHAIQFMLHSCPQSSQCISFGENSNLISAFFKGFDLRSGLVTHLEKFGAAISLHVNVYEATFQRDGYFGHALVKVQKDAEIDNLLYEHTVGKFLNAYCDLFPCLVRTYGLYRLQNRLLKSSIHNTGLFPTMFDPVNTIDPFDDYNKDVFQQVIASHCDGADKNVLVTHFIKGSVTLREFLNGDETLIINNFFGILYQLYFCLEKLGSMFSHYDMHENNILVYKLDEPIRFRFPYVEFTCEYLTKMIDYAHTFFQSPSVGSIDFAETKCPGFENVQPFRYRNPKIEYDQAVIMFFRFCGKVKKRGLLIQETGYFLDRTFIAATKETRIHEEAIYTLPQLMDAFSNHVDFLTNTKQPRPTVTLIVTGSSPMTYAKIY